MGYRAELDGLRALAVCAVIGFHAGLPGFHGGSVGVQWFFVLSGLLITTLLLEEASAFGSIGLRRFYTRRAIRLLPDLYLMLLVFLVLSLTFVGISGLEFLSAGLYFSNIHTLVFGAGASPVFFLHIWSLSLEEQFYLCWPVLLKVIKSKRTLKWMGVGAISLAYVARTLQAEDVTHTEWLTLPVFSVDGFAIGALLAWVIREGQSPRIVRRAITPILGGLLMAFDVIVAKDSSSATMAIRSLASQLAVAAVLVHLIENPSGRLPSLLRSKPLVYIGLISYSLYLWHFPIFELFTAAQVPTMSRWLRHVLKFSITIASSVLTYELVDKRMARFRAKFRPRSVGSELLR